MNLRFGISVSILETLLGIQISEKWGPRATIRAWRLDEWNKTCVRFDMPGLLDPCVVSPDLELQIAPHSRRNRLSRHLTKSLAVMSNE